LQPWDRCPSNGAEPYGIALATRPPLSPLRSHRFHPFKETVMGRGLLLGTADWIGDGAKTAAAASPVPTRLVFGTVHLESFVGEAEDRIVIPNRRAQLVEAVRVLEAEMEARDAMAAVLMGDFNWNDQKDGDTLELVGGGWADAFIENGQVRGTTATCYSWRLDRCLYKLRSKQARHSKGMRLTNFCLAGKEQGPLLEGRTFTGKNGKTNKLYPSDHKGLAVTFES